MLVAVSVLVPVADGVSVLVIDLDTDRVGVFEGVPDDDAPIVWLAVDEGVFEGVPVGVRVFERVLVAVFVPVLVGVPVVVPVPELVLVRVGVKLALVRYECDAVDDAVAVDDKDVLLVEEGVMAPVLEAVRVAEAVLGGVLEAVSDPVDVSDELAPSVCDDEAVDDKDGV